MEQKIVSVIIPCHNNSKTIGRAIKSVLNQTYSNIELIVIDDCSSDNSVDVIKNIKDNRIRLYQNKTNLRAGPTRNFGMDKAVGAFISFLDADDCYAKNKIELDIEFLNKNTDFDLVCNNIVSMGLLNKELDQLPFQFKEIDMKGLFVKSSVYTSTVTMRNNIKERFPVDYKTSEDLLLWCKIILNGHRIAKTNRQTTFYNNELSNRLSLNYKSQYIHEKKVVDFAYTNKAISKGDKNYLKFLYFVKFLRRPIKFRIMAHKEKKMLKQEGK